MSIFHNRQLALTTEISQMPMGLRSNNGQPCNRLISREAWSLRSPLVADKLVSTPGFQAESCPTLEVGVDSFGIDCSKPVTSLTSLICQFLLLAVALMTGYATLLLKKEDGRQVHMCLQESIFV